MRKAVRDGPRENERKADRGVNSGRLGWANRPAGMLPVNWFGLVQGRIWVTGRQIQRRGAAGAAVAAGRTLILPCAGNILELRSEAGRTMEWAQAHFFVGPVAVL
jgi:hypothetical protein